MTIKVRCTREQTAKILITKEEAIGAKKKRRQSFNQQIFDKESRSFNLNSKICGKVVVVAFARATIV